MTKIRRNLFSTMQGIVGKGIVATLCLIITGLFFVAGCKKEEDFEARTYYSTIGEGYVFMYNATGDRILYPAQGAKVIVGGGFGGQGLLGFFYVSPPADTFTVDATGKYQVRFLKRTYRQDIVNYYFEMAYYQGRKNVGWSRAFSFPVDKVKNAQNTIALDTIKLYINELY